MFKISCAVVVTAVFQTFRINSTISYHKMPRVLSARNVSPKKPFQHTVCGLSSHLRKEQEVPEKREQKNARSSPRKRKHDLVSSAEKEGSDSQLTLRSSDCKLSQKQISRISDAAVTKGKKSSLPKQKKSTRSKETSPKMNTQKKLLKVHDDKKVAKKPKVDSGVKILSEEELQIRFNKRLENLKRNMISGSVPVFRILCDRYEQQRDEKAASAMAKFLLNKFEFFGLMRPQRLAAWKDLWQEVGKLSPSDKRTLACQTWFSPEREFQYFTIELLHKEKTSIYGDLGEKDSAIQTLDFVRQFITHPATWWDTVDISSTRVIGPLVKEFPDELLPVMDEWNVSSSFWLARASIIYQLCYREDTDVERLFRYCKKLAHEEEFFIRKAIGWALREYHKTDPAAVRNFVQKNKKILSTLSIKEALKHDKLKHSVI